MYDALANLHSHGRNERWAYDAEVLACRLVGTDERWYGHGPGQIQVHVSAVDDTGADVEIISVRHKDVTLFHVDRRTDALTLRTTVPLNDEFVSTLV